MSRMMFYRFPYYFLFLLLLISCHKEPENRPEEQRVLLFYMAVDEPNISFDLNDKIESILLGAQSTSGDILIYSDAYWSAPRLDQVVTDRGRKSVETLETFEQENSASPEVLRRVIDRMTEIYPDRRYGLVVFTHSSGWLPAGTLLNPMAEISPSRSIGIDDNPGYGKNGRQEMELVDFSNALPDGLFDFILFESCLTANVEVVYELRRKTPYVLASAAEIVSPGFSTVYPGQLPLLTDLNYGTEKALTDFASAFFEKANTSDYDYSGTISVINTQYMEELARVTRRILAEPSSELGSIDQVQYFDRYRIYQYPSYSRFFDLEDYIERIASGSQFAAFSDVLQRTVPYARATSSFLLRYQGFEIRRHCGLTTYIERPQYESGRINSEWRKTSWFLATH